MGVRQSKESLDPSGRSVKHDYNSRKKDTKRVCIVGGGAAGMYFESWLSGYSETNIWGKYLIGYLVKLSHFWVSA